jgi:predicted DNA-binding ribbon-helix-helix protein
LIVTELKRSITIAGHRTSISLEPEFWQMLQKLAQERGKTMTAIVGDIDQTRGERNLSSALRVWILDQLSNAHRD